MCNQRQKLRWEWTGFLTRRRQSFTGILFGKIVLDGECLWNMVEISI